ncbi:MAG: hypothetical protein K9M80_03955 [Candidatus Marinimicrobia bacterium]|nr:hypothetical protein [Candidatus Neomarinimicrobiota bacterium]
MYFLRTSSQHLRKFSNQNTAEEGKREYGKWKPEADKAIHDALKRLANIESVLIFTKLIFKALLECTNRVGVCINAVNALHISFLNPNTFS